MAFDLNTAKPVDSVSSEPVKKGFDLASAKAVDHEDNHASHNMVVDALVKAAGVGIPPLGIYQSPEALPMAGQTLGSIIGGYGGGIIGATAGQTVNQGVRALKGQGFDGGEIVKEAGRTAAIDGAFRGAGKLVFRKEFASKAMNEIGNRLGKIKGMVEDAYASNPNVSVATQRLQDIVSKTLDSVKVKFGPQFAPLVKWSKHLNNMAKNGINSANPNLVAELERDLGDIAKFSTSEIGGVSLSPAVKKSSLNQAVKAARSEVSGIYDDMAETAGFPEFKTLSKKISALKEKYPNKELQSGSFIQGVTKLGQAAGAGSLGYLATGSQFGALAGFALAELLQSPEIRNSLFKILVNKGLGNATSIATNEGVRRLLGKS
jgi:hypothetical protein